MSLGTSAAGLGLVLVGADIGIRPQAYPNTRGLEPVFAGVGGAALLVGPSLGSVYADRFWNTGFALRIAGLGVGALGFATALWIADRHPNAGTNSPLPILSSAVAGVMYLAGATYEIATTPSAVERYNREHEGAATLSLSLIRARDGGVAPGMALSGRF